MSNPRCWVDLLEDEKLQPYFQQTLEKITTIRNRGLIVYPEDNHIFEAFKLTPLKNLKVVILGQDPYHNPAQAHGLCFSVNKGITIPPSLKNIYNELKSDIGCEIASHGNLEDWGKQGVFLLNTVLTVEAGKPQSHQDLGWQQFTDKVISLISQHCKHVVFLLWGANAHRKLSIIDSNKHSVLMAPHPSPLSAYRGFVGCKHFSQCNQALINHQQSVINWCIKD